MPDPLPTKSQNAATPTPAPAAEPPTSPQQIAAALKPSHERYAQLVASGMAKAKAYRKAFNRPKATREQAGDRTKELNCFPQIAARIAELQSKSEGKTLLTLNDRLRILAEIATKKKAKDTDKTRAIKVYSEISGDRAPDPEQVIKLVGDASRPLEVVSHKLTVRERIARNRAARASRPAEEESA